jgi:deferrochelatase/peroxidase EfeB
VTRRAERAEPGSGPPVSRRALLGGIGAAGAGAVLGGLVVADRGDRASAETPVGANDAGAVEFYGSHQAGIATPVQDRLLFGSFDVLPGTSRADLVALLKDWTAIGARLAAGRELGRNDVAPAPPDDTGEALGLSPSRLTMTFGFGPTLFALDGADRFGIASARPAALIDLPPFDHDNLDPTRSDGDIAVQVCADDPQVTFHALRNLTRRGKGVVGLRWSQLGFGRTSSTSQSQETPRNLMGFKDGTNNVHGDDDRTMDGQIWVASSDSPAWMRDGSYLVARRIRMRIENWDRDFLQDQENVIGRAKASGAPLGQKHEFDKVDLKAKHGGTLVVPEDAHIRLAAPATNGGAKLLRRGYSFTDGVDPRTAGLDAGLFFLAYQRDPRRQFVPIQRRLASSDSLNEYIEHNSSAIFAIPPGVRRGGWIGETLFT